ncbi:MAG: hypothetical protein Q9181_001150 [Wetmoreana brouardii]
MGNLYHPYMVKEWLSLPPEQGQNASSTKKVSLAAIFILSAPSNMAKFSVLFFLLGLTIHQGFTWTHALDADASHNYSRNVFVTFIVGMGLPVLFYVYNFSFKISEGLLRASIRDDVGVELSSPASTGRSRSDDPVVDHPIHPLVQGNKALAAKSLSVALEIAAEAHIRCAEADRRVALEYERMFRAMT